MLALPALWYGSLSMLLGVIPLTTPEERAPGLGPRPSSVRGAPSRAASARLAARSRAPHADSRRQRFVAVADLSGIARREPRLAARIGAVHAARVACVATA